MPRTAWNRRLTPEIEDLIVQRYRDRMRAREILSLVPVRTRKMIYDVLERHGVERRPPTGTAGYKTSDQGAFANVDTDGYVSATRRSSEPQSCLQPADGQHVERFRAFLRPPNPVLRTPPRSATHRGMFRVTVHSARMARDLARYGVVPRKTRLTYLPGLEPRLMPHLIRGVCDGDGTISNRSDGGSVFGFCGSPRLIAELRMWLTCTLAVADDRIHDVNSVSVIQWSHKTDVKELARYLYGNATVSLERKYRLVEELL